MVMSRTWKFCETEVAVINMNVQINVAKGRQETINKLTMKLQKSAIKHS